MKKFLAIVLSVMLVVISIAPVASAVYTPGITSRAINGNYDPSKTEEESPIENGVFTLILKMPAVTGLTAYNVYVEFDSDNLTYVKSDAAGTGSDDDFTPNFPGVFVSGIKTSYPDRVGFGWISTSGVNKSEATDFAYVTFKVKDVETVQQSLSVVVEEFTDNDDSHKIVATSPVLEEVKAVHFDLDSATEPVSVPDVTEENSARNINSLLDVIRNLLAGNGATWEDVADAVANVLGNAELTDMIGQLVDGDINIADAFQSFLSSLGLDGFGDFGSILQKVIDFIKGLFGGNGGGDETTQAAPATTNSTSTTAAAGADDTTSAGSNSGSEKTGDVGIALAATVCVAASAAFVLTRKKKED